MASNSKIRAGKVCNINMESGDWFIVDIGWVNYGIAINQDPADQVGRRELVRQLVGRATEGTSRPLNLLLEAPLSMAFDPDGNPMIRGFETPEGIGPRRWYFNAGASTMHSAATILDELSRCRLRRRIRLFEGFAPLQGADDAEVADMLRQLILNPYPGAIIPPNQIIAPEAGTLRPIIGISEREPRIPPVISVLPAQN